LPRFKNGSERSERPPERSERHKREAQPRMPTEGRHQGSVATVTLEAKRRATPKAFFSWYCDHLPTG